MTRARALYMFIIFTWLIVASLYGLKAFAYHHHTYSPPPATTPPPITSPAPVSGTVVGGYWTNWSIYNGKAINGSFMNAQYSHMNTLYYAFVYVNSSGQVIPSDTQADITDGQLVAFSATPVANHILSVGGGTSQGLQSSNNAMNNIPTFVASIGQYINTYHLQGIDLDYEPNGAVPPSSIPKLIALVKALRTAYPNIIIQWDVTANYSNIAAFGAANWQTLMQSLTYVNVMAYEMYGAWDPSILPNSPTLGSNYPYTADNSIKALESAGVKSNQIILGLGFFAQLYTANSCAMGIKWSSIPSGDLGTGYASYASLANAGYLNTEIYVGSTIIGTFGCKGTTIATFDDQRSIISKSNYASANHLGGVAIWSLPMDALYGSSTSLLTAINTVIQP